MKNKTPEEVENPLKMWSWVCVIFVVAVLTVAIVFIHNHINQKHDPLTLEQVEKAE